MFVDYKCQILSCFHTLNLEKLVVKVNLKLKTCMKYHFFLSSVQLCLEEASLIQLSGAT